MHHPIGENIESLRRIRAAMVDVLIEIDNAMNGEKTSASYWAGLCSWWQCCYPSGDAARFYPGDVIYECVRSGRID